MTKHKPTRPSNEHDLKHKSKVRDNVNRQTILASIHHHLRDSFAETGEARPLGEIVPLVAQDIRAQHVSDPGGLTTRVIPIEQVAAFVDGHLASAEVQAICEAVMVDNSVLAELIAAVRATHESNDQCPPLSDTLTAQLLAMKSDLPMVASTPGDTSSLAGEIVSPAVDVFAAPRQNGRVRPHRMHATDNKKHFSVNVVIGMVTLAASILAIVYFAKYQRGNRPEAPNHSQLVENDSAVPKDVLEPKPPAVDPTAIHDNDRMAADSRDDAPVVQPSPDLPDVSPATQSDRVVEIDTPDVMDPDFSPKPQLDPEPPETPSSPKPRRLASLQWTKITGLVAGQPLLSTSSSGATTRPGNWRSVQTSALDREDISLRTMPLSRAEADLEGGGKIVLSADSGLQISRRSTDASADFDLTHGAVAIINLPDGTVINLVRGDEVVTSLRWTEKASAVLERVAAGFQVHVNHGTITVNDQPRQSESLRIAGDRSIESIQRPKRLPNWVDRPSHSIGVPRTILAQFAQSDNVGKSLSARIRELAAAQRLSAGDQRELATLANWQATMADAQLFRLANSRIPALRQAAIQRLVNMPETDGRFKRTWFAMSRINGNQQKIAGLRRWCEMARRDMRPNQAQTEQMIHGLSAQDVASRAMADFMLRKFYGNNIPFDPTWTGAQQQRAINLWRKRFDMPALRNAAGPAALAPNRNN